MRRKIYQFVKVHINTELINTLIIFFVTSLIFIKKIVAGEKVSFVDSFSNSILISFLILGVARMIADVVTSIIARRCEDVAKLSSDYAMISKRYISSNLFTIDSKTFFPIEVLGYCKDFRVKDDPYTFFKLPSFIADNADSIMEVHKYSVKYNNINVRLDDLHIENETAFLDTSRSTYFDSLLTNKAMDFQFRNLYTIRELYEPGPYIKELRISKMSNHLGFNGIVISKDQKIIIIHRGNAVAVSKDKYSCSISASLKTQYAVDGKSNRISKEGILNAVNNEIKDELKIDQKNHGDIMIYMFYRDLVQGGKPEFFFYVYAKQTAEEIISNFDNIIGTKAQHKKDTQIDGVNLRAFSIDEITNCVIKDLKIIAIGGIDYEMPAASIVCLMTCLEQLKIQTKQ